MRTCFKKIATTTSCEKMKETFFLNKSQRAYTSSYWPEDRKYMLVSEVRKETD